MCAAGHLNSGAKSFLTNLTNKLTHHQHFSNREHARQTILSHIEVFYNRLRIHYMLQYYPSPRPKPRT
ncbi:IS3 family transposase [Achromobacter marplatensis]|uniref:IS3 family transposase n=1 Tax=Achromobacter marplatensis TaxID=470868 RepID=UPI0039F6A016